MSRWFRSYIGTARDPKFVGIAIRSKQPVERVLFVWQCILESAAEKNNGGTFVVNGDEIAYFLRCDSPGIDSILEAMKDAALINDEDAIVKWGDRQFVSGGATTGAERQAKYMQNKKEMAAEAKGAGPGDDVKTSVVTKVRQQTDNIPSVYVSVSDSGSEESGKKGESLAAGERAREAQPQPKPLPLAQAFEMWWRAYPLKKGRGQAERAFKTAYETKAVELKTLIDGIASSFHDKPDWQNYPHASTWLNGERWLDEPAPKIATESARPPPWDRPKRKNVFFELGRKYTEQMNERDGAPFGGNTAADESKFRQVGYVPPLEVDTGKGKILDLRSIEAERGGASGPH